METTDKLSTHEPAPTGEGQIILELAVRRCDRMIMVSGKKAASCGADGQRSRLELDFGQSIHLVKTALIKRAEMGRAKYGTYLRAHNGRNAVVDFGQEILDAIMYGEQCAYQSDPSVEGGTYNESVVAAMLPELYKMAAKVAAIL